MTPMSDDSSWPPRVRESHEPQQSVQPPPPPEDPLPSAPEPPEVTSPESIGAVDHGETRVNRRAAKKIERAERRVERAREKAERVGYDEEDAEPGDRDRLLKGLLIGGTA